MKSEEIVWVEARCPVCKMKFSFIKSIYIPKTCNNYDCAREYVRHKDKYTKGGDANQNKSNKKSQTK